MGQHYSSENPFRCLRCYQFGPEDECWECEETACGCAECVATPGEAGSDVPPCPVRAARGSFMVRNCDKTQDDFDARLARFGFGVARTES